MSYKKVVLIDQELPNYRAQVLSEMNRRLGIGLIVYSPPNEKWQDFLDPAQEDVDFTLRTVSATWLPDKKLLWLNYFSVILREKDASVIIFRHWIRHPLLIPALLFCRLRGIRTIVWGQGFSRNRPFRPWRNIFDFLNLTVTKIAHAYVAYSGDVKRTLAKYVTPEKLFVGTNTINLREIDHVLNDLKRQGREQVRLSLSLRRRRYLVFVGRLKRRKRIDFLIAAYRSVLRIDRDVGLLIIGGGPEESSLKRMAESYGDGEVHFLGPLDFRRSAPYLFCSDVMVIPGWLGLAVNHGFYFGLPVVTCEGGLGGTGHPPEIEWLQDGVTGKISGARDPEGFAEDLKEVLDDRKRLGANARKFYEQELEVGRMIQGFKDALEYVSQLRRSKKT